MLKLTLSTSDLAGPWAWHAGRLSCGSSQIEALRHPALEVISATDGHRTLLCVRERSTSTGDRAEGDQIQHLTPERLRAAARECHQWALEHITVDMDSRARTATVAAGSFGTLPLYLTATDGQLHGSWHLPDLRGHCDVKRLDLVTAAGLLTGSRRYSHHTMFDGVWMLTERSTAAFGPSGLRLTYPDPAEHGLPRDLARGVDPVQVFETLLAEACSRRPLDRFPIAVQLSGGVDSANVAMTLGRLHPGQVTAAGLLIGGDAGVQQTIRRAHMIATMRLGNDVAVTAGDHLPFAAGALRADRQLAAGPDEEPYLEMASTLATAVSARGGRMVFTGFGGDEFSAPHQPRPQAQPRTSGRWPLWITHSAAAAADQGRARTAPASRVHRTVLQAIACADPLQVRAGLWPVHPFADQRLIRFGEWLPDRWRHGKRLQRRRLATELPHDVVRPALRENFAHLMAHAVHRHLAPLLLTWLPELRLADTGLLEVSRLARDARTAAADPDAAGRLGSLYGVVALESYLRALEEHDTCW